MDLDPEGIFRDDSDEDDDNVQEREANKEMVVYLVDASPKMFTPASQHKTRVGTSRLDSFMDNIGSRYGITAGSRENTLYNALWVAQALLRKGYVHFRPLASVAFRASPARSPTQKVEAEDKNTQLQQGPYSSP
ncbi:hypothetical protein HU200_005883 [Digitaria exilis]|uniref:Ku70/Ku80 N-terminal alpha/beta domain-containing protein n=1 Tax=Digitaria exilis TaxID=1010633 RepID=A0A835FT76_9POAL|nr:hypothetical protein HU200_005883 [Digitaria exilis]